MDSATSKSRARKTTGQNQKQKVGGTKMATIISNITSLVRQSAGLEPVFRSDDQILEEMKAHNKKAIARSQRLGPKKGQTIFSLKHYITIDKEEPKGGRR